MMSRPRYDPSSYANEPLHYAASEGNADLVQELMVAKRANIYKPASNGETALHVALYHQQWDVCNVLLGGYERDFRWVEEYFARRFQWDAGREKVWLKRKIAVACSEGERERALEMEQSDGLDEFDEDSYELVLLANASDESSRVVGLRVTERNQQELKNFMESLGVNGFLSWETRGSGSDSDTLLQLAVFRGEIDLIKRLIQNGANLAQLGRSEANPLMEACITKNMAVVRLLMEEYGDRFDLLAANRYGDTALSYILRKADAEAFDYVLHRMMECRKSKFLETDSEAFNKVFRHAHPHFPESNIWCLITGKETFVVPYLQRYDYDLSFRSDQRIMLMELIIRHFGKEYYEGQIRQKPELLELADQDGFNVLHSLLTSNELEFVRELYGSRTEQCRDLFEREKGSVICVAHLLMYELNDALRFLLETHLEYIGTIADKVMDEIDQEDIVPEGFLDETIDIWISFLPEMERRVDELKFRLAEEEMERARQEEEDPGLTYRLCGGLDGSV